MDTCRLAPPLVPDASLLEKLLSQWEDDRDTVIRLWEQAAAFASPKALIRRAAVTLPEEFPESVCVNGVCIHSPLMRRHFAPLSEVYPYAVTCGRELYEWCRSLSDMIENYIADEICKLYLSTMAAYLHDYVNETFITDSQGQVASMNPGSLPQEWPLYGQRQLFAILETAHEDVGIELTPSCLMIPSKSSSGIFFASAREYHNCMLCPRTDCPNRRAPYAGEA